MNTSTPRLPANYRLILDVVNANGPGRHTNAQDVYLRARELRPGIGFTTVHRGLARLHELGYVLKLDITGEGSAMYEPATAAHAHLRCTVCGTVADVDYASDAAIRAALEARHGIAIQGESITFTGRCRTCASSERGSATEQEGTALLGTRHRAAQRERDRGEGDNGEQ